MSAYKAPISDMEFLLFDVFMAHRNWQDHESLCGVLDIDTAKAMLVEAGKIASGSLATINRSGDEQGVQLVNGSVTTPDGFKAAYTEFCSAGFTALTGNPAYGGLGMPKALAVLIDEMMYAANSAFNLYPALSSGACLALDAHGCEQLKQRYLPMLYSGKWSGTMCLTEPHAGSDLGLIRTKAQPTDSGTYLITGTKIFITGGDHDLSENIVHLVLAKLPGAPDGSKGISLFLVPKYKVREDGELGESNGVSCGSIEHKMGIKASATCEINFLNAEGYLIGEINRGLQCMFTMMNCERLSIGIQGIGCAEASYQQAVSYAKERLQGKDPQKTESTTTPILAHPDVRRMLLNIKSLTEAGRAFAVYLGLQLDKSKLSAPLEDKRSAETRIALLTPVAKAFFTDMGLDCTIQGQQVFGGHGYIREWGQEQLVRDVRIAQIYEGTNGIQAMDLLQRKVVADKGAAMYEYLNEITAFIEHLCAFYSPQTSIYNACHELLHYIDRLSTVTEVLIQSSKESPMEIGSAANDYLHAVGYVSYGYMWLKMMHAVKTDSSKSKTGSYYFSRILPRIESLILSINSGSAEMMAFEETEF